MQRFISHAVRRSGFSRGRCIVLGVAGALLALAMLPAVATAAPQTLTVEKKGTGTGTVTSSPAGINCGATCSAPFTEGATVVLKGAAGPNTATVVWSGCGKVNLENECSVTMSTAKTVTATFNLLERTLTVSKKGTGTGTVTSSPAGINCGATCSASFVKETAVTLTGTPGGGTEPVVWSGCGSVTAENKCVVTMGTAKTITATFDLPSFQLTVTKNGTGAGTVTSSPAGINCGATCSAPFAEKSTVTLTASPGPNTEPTVTWTGCGSVVEGKCLVTMSGAKAVTATFKLVSRQLTVIKAGAGTGKVTSSPAGIECGATCSASFEHGTLVTLTGLPGANTDSTVQWTGCDSVNVEGKCLATMSAAKEVTATFNLVKWQLTITKTGTGTGTVTSSPAGIECGAQCAAGFTHGTKVVLEGNSGLHTKKVKWAGCTEVITADNKCVVLMSSAKTVIANFELESQYLEHTVTVQRKGTGAGTVTSTPAGIDCGEDCTEVYLHKTLLKLVATPASGSVFDHWVGGGCTAQVGPTCEALVTTSRIARAVFTAVGPRKLTVSKAGTGQGAVESKPAGIACGATCSAEFEAPAKVVLKATPSSGSTFAGWSGACSGTATCRVTMNEARNVTASFAKLPTGPSEVWVASTARVKNGKALVRMACNGQSPCEGTLKLLLKIKNAQGQTKGLVIGSIPFSLAAGTARTLAVKLGRRGLRELRSTGKLKTRVVGGSESHWLRLSS
jgi:List-Bact-rpt repeat protein